MKVRTKDELSQRLADDLAWRKKELSDLYFLLNAKAAHLKEQALSRSGIALLYAHWEGYIKKAGHYFFEYIAMQRLKNNELPLNLLTISMHSEVTFSPESKKYSSYSGFVDFFSHKMNDRGKIPYKNIVDTESNLSSTVFKEIVWCVGIDYSPFETKEKFVDNLVNNRNHIAHGEEVYIKAGEFLDMRNEVIGMLTVFKDSLENTVQLGLYKI